MIFLGFDDEVQVVNGKQYTDWTANDFSKSFSSIFYKKCSLIYKVTLLDMQVLIKDKNYVWSNNVVG